MTNEKFLTVVDITAASNVCGGSSSTLNGNSKTTTAANGNSLIQHKISKNESDNESDDNEGNTPGGFFRKAIPIMPKKLAIMCCIFNILFPGLGIGFLILAITSTNTNLNSYISKAHLFPHFQYFFVHLTNIKPI
jgi:hypothetical protein